METKYLCINIIGYFFYIIYSTLSTQDLVVPTNVALTNTNSVVRIPPSYFVVHGEKHINLMD
jgi:hypothetical protein